MKKGEALQKWNAMSDAERRRFTLLATDTRDGSSVPPGAPAAAQSEDASK